MLEPSELQIESWPSNNGGGMRVGTSGGVKITHKPTRISVAINVPHRSQHRNKEAAMKVLLDQLNGGGE